jgi:thiamine-phosphate pyrophosphorylase
MSSASLALITPPVADVVTFRPHLEAALGAAKIASVHLRLAAADEHEAKRMIAVLGPLIQDSGAALLINVPPDLREVARWNADGVHLSDPAGMEAALQALKPDRIVGAGGLRTKDLAMHAGENGCDYVMFGEPRADGTVPPLEQVLERCRWWAEVFTTPSMGYAEGLEAVAPLASTGLEFVVLGAWTFTGSPADVAARVRAAQKALGS